MNEEKDERTPDLSGIISQISSNPNALAMLGSLLGNMKPSIKPTDDSPKEDQMRELIVPRSNSSTFEDRKKLLMALKPFLSPERCQTVDMLLMILEALSVFQKGKRG